MPVRAATILGLSCLVASVTVSPAQAAAPGVRLSRASGPPTTITAVKGQGFGSSETIDIRFDVTLVATTTSDASGSFSKSVMVPVSALPGTHQIKAKGETSNLLAKTVFTVRTDWQKFHFDATNSGLNPYENVLSTSNVSGITQRWATLTAGVVESSPAVVRGVVYVSAGDVGVGQAELYAIRTSNGTVIWSQVIGGQDPSDPTVAGSSVYLGTLTDHSLRSFDASTGDLRWTFNAAGSVGTPTVVGNVAYVSSGAFLVYAIDTTTGTKIWSAHTGGDVYFSTPAVANGTVFVGSEDGNVYAFDATTGSPIWTAVTGGPIHSSPAVSQGTLFIGSSDDQLHAFDAATGAPVWAGTTGGDVESSPAVANGLVYVGSDDDNIYAFDATTGAERWAVPTGNAIQLGSPSVANGVVYTGSEDQSIYAMDAATGVTLWTFATGGLMNTSPAIADGVLYMGSFDDYIYSFGLP